MPDYKPVELSQRPDWLEMVWDWQRRARSYCEADAPTLAEVQGPRWAHFCLLADGEPRVVISLEECRPEGYEVHVNTAPGTDPRLTRWFIECVVTAVLTEPEARLVAWIAEDNRAALRLARRYMTEETRVFEAARGRNFVRLGVSGAEWSSKWAKVAKAAA